MSKFRFLKVTISVFHLKIVSVLAKRQITVLIITTIFTILLLNSFFQVNFISKFGILRSNFDFPAHNGSGFN